MDLQVLRCFCAVAAEGSLSKAAQRLHYAQSNLSTRIAQLEQEIGSPLFYRNRRGVVLTPKGELLLKYATSLLNLAEDAMIAMKDDEITGGNLRIGSMESTVVTYLTGFLAQFRKANLQTTVQVETGTTEAMLQKVLDHQLNGAFVAGPISHPDLLTKQVRTEKLCLIASQNLAPNHSTRALLAHPLLVFPQGCSYRKALEHWMKDEGIVPNRVYEFNTLNAIFASAAAGLGIALFPEACIAQYQKKDMLISVEVPEKYALLPTVFIYRKDSYLSKAMRSFIQLL